MNLKMFGLGVFLILLGIAKIRSTKRNSYMGVNWRLWAKLYGESTPRAVNYGQGIGIIMVGVSLIVNAIQ